MFSKRIKVRISIILCSLMILTIIGTLNLFSKIEDGYKEQVINEMNSLMVEATNLGIEIDFNEVELKNQSLKDLIDAEFLLKFAIENQSKVNKQMIEVKQLAYKSQSLVTPSEEYITKEACKTFNGNTILNINNSNLSFPYKIDINIRYSFIQNIDEYGVYTQKMYKVLDVHSNVNNDNINKENFTIKNFEQKDWYISKMTDSYAEICGAAKYTLEVPGQGLITCTVPFSTRLNAGEDLFSCEFESLIDN
ncbi:MAG: hypothetical protein KID00_00445 [Clostridium argentinense]|uniref:hypothetical protein n=1 Tax=Clostridium butanoliproducens TaxID=2991837 RepID=UPI001D95F875|nr:hypothetical protein [Clostridium butanoliproducens]MBS5822324.1 hypothetical protein [Clostridium argentinense]MDU1348500.1 hypothetical protein [Clostridium argentinense]